MAAKDPITTRVKQVVQRSTSDAESRAERKMQLALQQHRESMKNELHAEGAIRDAKQRTDLQLSVKEGTAQAEQRIEAKMRSALATAYSDINVEVQRQANQLVQSEAHLSARIDELSARVDAFLSTGGNTTGGHSVQRPERRSTDAMKQDIAACIADATKKIQAVAVELEGYPHDESADTRAGKRENPASDSARAAAGRRKRGSAREAKPRTTRIAGIVERLQRDVQARADAAARMYSNSESK